jgi:pimeloyl-ACP methyl ester carboxylesterase
VKWRYSLKLPVYKGPRVFLYATQFVETPVGPISYFDQGRGHALVFVHGLGGDFTHFEHIAPAFVDRFRVIGLDMPGCGDSCKPRSRHSLKSYADTLLAALDQLGVKKATLVGHSAGGAVCAMAALMAPERVEDLVLINTAGLRYYPPLLRLAARMLIRRPIIDGILLISAYAILEHVFTAKNEFTRKFAEDNIHRPRAARLADIGKVIADLLPDLMSGTLSKDADRLEHPTLLIWGADDRLMPLETVRRAAALLPGGQLAVLDGCGHMPLIENPGEVISLIETFVTRRRARVRLEAVP